MKAIRVSELKNHLSQYLRQAQAGEQIIVMDRDEPVAQLGPALPPNRSERETLSAQGVLLLGNQKFSALRFSRTKKRVDAQALLRAIRED